MGIFSKKPPCAICGGKVEFFLPLKIEGEYVCNDCADKIDMPDDRRKALTMEGLREYLAFYEGNRSLKDRFLVSRQIQMGLFNSDEMLFDYEHRLFCMDEDLKKLVFEGKSVQSFTIREDNRVIFEGTPKGLQCNESNTVARAEAMIPQANLVRLHNHIEEERERRERLNGDDNQSAAPIYHSHYEFKEPFEKFYVDIYVEHPYYSVISYEMSGPQIISSDPDINEYLSEYDDEYATMKDLAEALMNVAFPGAGSGESGARVTVSGGSVQSTDAVAEIKQYKELLDSGIITQEEFDAKKKQLMGI